MTMSAEPGRTGRGPNVGQECLTVPEAAEYARVSARTMYEMIRKGRGPVITRVGLRRFIIRSSDLEYWMNANAVRGATSS